MTCPETYLPITLNVFPAITSGDMYPTGLEFREDAEDADLASVTCIFYADPAQTSPSLTLSSALGTITIDSATAGDWIFTIPAFVMSLAAGNYFYHVRTIDVEGAKRTILNGILTVAPAL